MTDRRENQEGDEVFQALVRVLRDHDVPYDREGVRAACREGGDAVREWVEEVLGEETLLSKDEANLYASLVKNGEAQRYEAQDLSLVQGVSDVEIHTAIEELKRSTEAIEKQTEILKVQQSAMSSLVRNERKTAEARAHIDQEQLRKWDVEKGQIGVSIEELSQTLMYQASDLEQQLKQSESTVKATIYNLLKSDDKLLLSLQKLASDLDPAKPETNDQIERVRELCARLIKHTVEGIRTKLDRVYLSQLANSENGSDANNQEIHDLQEELESLYTEILPVAQMAAEQQYLEPALRTVADGEGQGQERSVKAVQYILACLNFLCNRLETFLSRAQEVQSHNAALKFVISTAKSELAPPAPETPTKSPGTPRAALHRRRKSSVTTPSLRVRNTRRSSGHLDDDVDPEQQLARTLGITLPEPTATDAARVDFFDKALAERVMRLESHVMSLQATTETSISIHLADAHVTLGVLRDCLLKESEFGFVRLVDREVEEGVEDFERDVGELKEQLDEVDLRTLNGKSIARDHLVERWKR